MANMVNTVDIRTCNDVPQQKYYTIQLVCQNRRFFKLIHWRLKSISPTQLFFRAPVSGNLNMTHMFLCIQLETMLSFTCDNYTSRTVTPQATLLHSMWYPSAWCHMSYIVVWTLVLSSFSCLAKLSSSDWNTGGLVFLTVLGESSWKVC